MLTILTNSIWLWTKQQHVQAANIAGAVESSRISNLHRCCCYCFQRTRIDGWQHRVVKCKRNRAIGTSGWWRDGRAARLWENERTTQCFGPAEGKRRKPAIFAVAISDNCTDCNRWIDECDIWKRPFYTSYPFGRFLTTSDRPLMEHESFPVRPWGAARTHIKDNLFIGLECTTLNCWGIRLLRQELQVEPHHCLVTKEDIKVCLSVFFTEPCCS